MELRDADGNDTERIGELARSAMTAAYALSPQQLDTIVAERFETNALEDTLGQADSFVLVATNGESDDGDDEGDESEVIEDETVVGFVEGRVEDDRGELRWLFVDPEHRGRGVGTELFETGSERLHENGAGHVTASALEANTEGGTFFKRLGLEAIDEREAEIGTESFVEYVYADPDAVDESTTTEDEELTRVDDVAVTDADLPGTEERDGRTVAETDDGTEVYLDRETIESGVKGPFVAAYTDAERTERYGYLCSNCGSLDTVVGEAERIECADCANTHAERSAEAYDDSYL